MSAPKLLHTFVILAYKQSPYLQACVDSILAQTVPSEIIICTSTPNNYIQGIADKHGISVHVNTNGGSIGKDWNFGMRSAATQYVTLAHQDDIYHADFAEKCIALAEQNEASKPLMAFTRSLTYKGDKELSVSFKNIIMGRDVLYFFPKYFLNHYLPLIAVYNKKGELTNYADGGMPTAELIRLISE